MDRVTAHYTDSLLTTHYAALCLARQAVAAGEYTDVTTAYRALLALAGVL